jgi:hypothetical protein
MKKISTLILIFFCIIIFISCGKNNTYKISITIPAGSKETFVFSDEEIASISDKIIIYSTEELGDTKVLLAPVDENITAGYVAEDLTIEKPVELDASKGVWFKVGVDVENNTDTDKTVYVEVEGVEVRIE